MAKSAFEIADEFTHQVEREHSFGLKPREVYALALIRACKELQVYRASDTALDRHMESRPAQTPQDAAHAAEPIGDTNLPERVGTPEHVEQVKPVSGQSSVKCPNCEAYNEQQPSPYLNYLCFNCGYTETAL